MNILGLDTSTAASTVCVLRSDGAAFEEVPPVEALRGPPAHARELMPGVARVLAQAELGWDDLDAVAVGTGPGAYTGLRIGIATARALAGARRLPLHPVSSLAALAAGHEGPVLALIDARRGELFAALRVAGEERWPPFVADPDALIDRVRGARAELPATPLAVGDGSLRFRDVLEAGGVVVAPDESTAHIVRALQVCRLAAGVPATAPEAVLPTYLRAPDAEPRRR